MSNTSFSHIGKVDSSLFDRAAVTDKSKDVR